MTNDGNCDRSSGADSALPVFSATPVKRRPIREGQQTINGIPFYLTEVVRTEDLKALERVAWKVPYSVMMAQARHEEIPEDMLEELLYKL